MLPLAILYSVTLSALSLFNVQPVTQKLPEISDKAYHAIAHVIFTLVWFFVWYYKVGLKFRNAIVYAVLLSVCYGVAIEVFQGVITQYRQADLNDVFANVCGTIVAIIIIAAFKKLLKNYNSLLF